MEKRNQIEALEYEIFQKKIELTELNKEYFQEIFEKTFKGIYFKSRKSKYNPHSGTDEMDILAMPIFQSNGHRIVCRVFERRQNVSKRTYSLRIESKEIDIYDLKRMKEVSKEQAEKIRLKLIKSAEMI